MSLFNRKKSTPAIPTIETHQPIELVFNKSARKEVIEDAKKAQQHLNNLLVENGFTVKIVVLAGAHGGRNKRKGNK